MNTNITPAVLSLEDLQTLIASHIGMIEINAYAIREARERAAKFLVIQAHLTNHLKALEDIKVKATTLSSAQYAQAMRIQAGKNVTENKINAEADPNYAEARESSELIDAEINWVKKHHEMFGNAHVMFRQISMQHGSM